MRYALISDIHGNVLALEAVLNDMKKRNVNMIINAGDSLYGPLWPEETAKILIAENIASVMGNGDEVLIKEPNRTSTVDYTVKSLSLESLNWIKSLHYSYSDKILFCCHGKPDNNHEYLIEKIEDQRVEIKSESELAADIKKIQQSIIVCGHSHMPRVVKCGDKTIINAGSVGLPAYVDDEPIKHAMETFNPYAKYFIVEGLSIELHHISYDYKKAAVQASKNGRKDWEFWLTNGRSQIY